MKPTFVRQASIGDAESVSLRLRKEDRDEALAASGLDPRLILPAYVREGRGVLAAGLEETGRAEILFGVDPVLGCPEVGVAWLMATDVVFEHPQTFLPNSILWFEKVHEPYEVLTNFVDERNTRHLKWLQFLGCKLLRRVESFGAYGLPFIEFASYRPKCA